MAQMIVKMILEDWLKLHGYDGLYSADCECSCGVTDLCPCDAEGIASCQAGYLIPCPGEPECDCNLPHIGPRKVDSQAPAASERSAS